MTKELVDALREIDRALRKIPYHLQVEAMELMLAKVSVEAVLRGEAHDSPA